MNIVELEKLASREGWQVETDNYGQIVIYTGLYEISNPEKKE